jgi:hypothetical protein
MVDGRGGPDAGVVLCGRGSDSKTKVWEGAETNDGLHRGPVGRAGDI